MKLNTLSGSKGSFRRSSTSQCAKRRRRGGGRRAGGGGEKKEVTGGGQMIAKLVFAVVARWAIVCAGGLAGKLGTSCTDTLAGYGNLVHRKCP